MVSAHGGRGIEPVPATSVDDWKTVLGGLNRHGAGGGWWSGKKSKFGHVGNGLVDPFQMPEGTIDDGHADRLDSLGEWLGHNSVMLAMTGTVIIFISTSFDTDVVIDKLFPPVNVLKFKTTPVLSI